MNFGCWYLPLKRSCFQAIIQQKKSFIELKSHILYTREYQANNGVIEFDIRSMDARNGFTDRSTFEDVIKKEKENVTTTNYLEKIEFVLVFGWIQWKMQGLLWSSWRTCYLRCIIEKLASDELQLWMWKIIKATNNALSVGLGAGDQIESNGFVCLENYSLNCKSKSFGVIWASRALLDQSETVINDFSFTNGKIGYVNIATGRWVLQSRRNYSQNRSNIQIIAGYGWLH